MRYGCPQCPQRFATLREKKQHLRENHPRVPEKEGKDAV